MKLAVIVACVFLVFANGAQLRADPRSEKSHNPVVRVVNMLKELQSKLQADAETEWNLYTSFVCWGKSVIAQKTESNSAAESKISELEAVIGDLDSGKIELTSERTDLESEISTLKDESESAAAKREKDKADFELAKKQMEQAVAALELAIKTMEEATKADVQGWQMMAKGSGDCTGETKIQSLDECYKAHEALGLTSNMKYEGQRDDIPSACATRQGQSHDIHWNKASSGKGRSDLTPICRKASQTQLLSIRSEVTERMAEGGVSALEQRAVLVQKAVELSDKVLQSADANFLRRLLTGDVPEVDWSKLNRKATFKMKYKARSGKIVETLKKMLATFKENLAAAIKQEEDDAKAYEELSGAKDEQLGSAEGSLTEMATENGAKANMKQEKMSQKEALEEQIKNDEKFIKDTEASMAKKKEEYKSRKAMRIGELRAISKAIEILYSDEARDVMKKSYGSQGYFFLQQGSHVKTSVQLRLNKVATDLRQLAFATNDVRLLSIAPFGPDQKEAIKPAMEAIDALIEKLKSDEETDLVKKEACEKTRAEDTRSASLKSRTIDGKTEEINTLDSEIEQLSADIKATEGTMDATKAALAEATANREKEKKEYETSVEDDKEAVEVVKKAKQVIADFYTSNGLMLLQAPVVEAGKAPPAPPDTFEGEYTGATAESNGILTALDTIIADLGKDTATADAEEQAAAATYSEFKGDSETAITGFETAILKLKEDKAGKEQAKEDAIKVRGIAAEALDTLTNDIDMKAKGGCDYMAVNYELRVANRKKELDGLNKAKVYLSGGEFSKVDPDREMEPGDAAVFVQGHAIH